MSKIAPGNCNECPYALWCMSKFNSIRCNELRSLPDKEVKESK